MISGALGTTDIDKLMQRLCPSEKKSPKDTDEIPGYRAIVISGPTGCGKSELALTLAQKINGEIISADSMQVYIGMDIGTAKPTLQEQSIVPHHMIDVRAVAEVFNVVEFYHEALETCKQIIKRGKVPIIVGGSGFYLHTLLYGPPEGPESVPAIRKKLEKELDKIGLEKLYERLKKADPEYAKTISFHDKHKIIRGLEIMEISGKPVSYFSWKNREPDPAFCCWFLHRPKQRLYKRIDERCEKMLEDGFVDEVASLKEQGIEKNSTAAQAIGYRQVLDYLALPEEERNFEEMEKQFKLATHRYAKRQFTWFRREKKAFRWLDIDAHDPETAMDMILKDYLCS